MCRDLLGVLERSTPFKVGGNSGCPERVATDLRFDAGCLRAPADHSPGVRLCHRVERERPADLATRHRPEDWSFSLIPKIRGREVGVQILLEQVVTGNVMSLAAFLMEAKPPALALRIVVLDFQTERGVDAREGKYQNADQRSIAKTNECIGSDRIEEQSCFIARENRRLAALHDVLWTAHRARGIRRNDLADHQPVEKHPHCGEVLLDGRLRERLAALLNVRSNNSRVDLLESLDSVCVAPAEKTADRLAVRASRVQVPDVCGEELNEAPRCSVTGRGDRHRDMLEPGAGKLAVGWMIGHQWGALRKTYTEYYKGRYHTLSRSWQTLAAPARLWIAVTPGEGNEDGGQRR